MITRKIRIKLLTEGCEPVVHENGNAYDLVSAQTIALHQPSIDGNKCSFEAQLIPLGLAMELPKGCIANVRPRSSTYKKWGVLMANSVGLIDETYCGDSDEWKMSVVAFKDTTIQKGDRICQFEIRPAQTATFWQKFLWLITDKYEFVAVESLNHDARGGFGEGTDKK